MAARKTVVEEEVFEEEVFEDEPVVMSDGITTAVVKHEDKNEEPLVDIYLPPLEDSGSAGLVVDQYEHVTIANEVKDKVWYIHRGEHVQVPVSVYMVMKEKYPNL